MTPAELKAFRKGKQMNQAELASALGVSRKTVVNWEGGTFAVPSDIMARLAAAGALAHVATKQSTKAELAREAHERHEIKVALMCYRSTRAYCRNHTEAMRHYLINRSGPIPPFAYAAIVAEFPDILTDPNGDHAMSKEQALATVLETAKG